jgi:hypothetical protein
MMATTIINSMSENPDCPVYPGLETMPGWVCGKGGTGAGAEKRTYWRRIMLCSGTVDHESEMAARLESYTRGHKKRVTLRG